MDAKAARAINDGLLLEYAADSSRPIWLMNVMIKATSGTALTRFARLRKA